jgi:hypothetical protein
VFERWREKYGRFTARMLWDLFMVWVALINLGLIAFDLTYLWLRPYYFRHLPVVTRIYDPVKGIEPNSFTEEYREQLETALELARLAPGTPEYQRALDELETLTVRMIEEDPFERSGLSHNLEVMKQNLANETGRAVTDLEEPQRLRAAVHELFSGSSANVRGALERIQTNNDQLLRENYFREYDRSGHLVDYFWIVDLPFLLLFWVEFMVRWVIAIRRRTYARWYFFPIFNWYDVLGLVPVGYLRIFRLFRLVSMYMRLRYSELSGVGTDIFSRSVAYFSNIITEEVSDRVAVRILDEFSEEIRDGTHRRIILETMGTRRREIERVLAAQISELLTDETTLGRFRELLSLNLENAVDASESLQAVPVPNFVLRPMIRVVGEVIMDTTLETMQGTLATPEGQTAIEQVASAVIDELFTGPAVEATEDVVRTITLQVIEEMKSTVKVRKWALPEEDRRPHSLSDVVDGIAEIDADEVDEVEHDEDLGERGARESGV